MYYARHRVVMGTLYFAVKKFCISINNIFLMEDFNSCQKIIGQIRPAALKTIFF